MHYVIGDIHNEAKKLQSILNQIKIKPQDSLIVLGDIFDRGGTEADPVEVYFMLSGIQGELTWIRGNHDQWLADYVQKYYAQSERKRRKMVPYAYNTFEMMRKRLTQADMLHIAEQIQQLPLQKEMIIDGKSYLFAHAMTSHPAVIHKRGYYLMGNSSLDYYFLYGIDAGNLGRTVLFSGAGVHPAAIAGGYHDIYPCDPAESTGHGKVDRPGSTGSDYSGSLYVYLFRTEWLLLV